ncbi:AraC family transcriptional regulator [Pseudanabaena sp. FACHB-2040]|uniref:AraC family transcriptional regulator n=1 Tax=Pseudanabaena sp. FACHB-2040 TaxID=2692859 RepID=UPI001682866F|nr:AraC family transcriptional regulator [Pseudanabaena sp. FACHB-2040]MBD2259357.1 helix-turn-helix transcriptional regulator [Pseudanabaena sp. FACHB-2040]
MALNVQEIIVPPSPVLRDVVSHYWLGLNNANSAYVALPDGAVDLVFQVHCGAILSRVYGTTTARVDIPLEQGCDYFGIRFRPGQSRHFIQASAYELTDTHEASHSLLRFPIDRLTEAVLTSDVVHHFNRVLGAHLARLSPSVQPVDQVIHFIEAAGGAVRIGEAADVFGQSRRQFERVFLETVGVSAKTFARIIRFQHTAKLLTSSSNLSLSYVAAELKYFDQSHMSHDFKRLAGVSPAQFLQAHVAFLQDSHHDPALH